MFGFGKKNKKREEKEKQELEFITMESALNNVSPEEIFDKSVANKKEESLKKTEDDFDLPEKEIATQIKDQIKDQNKEKERLAQIEKRQEEVEKIQKEDLFKEDSINTRDIKPRKIEVPLEEKQEKQGLMIDEILKRKDEMTINKKMEKVEEQLPLSSDLMPEKDKTDVVQTLDIKRGKEMDELEKSIKSEITETKKKSKVKPIIKRLLEEIPEVPRRKEPKNKSAEKKTTSPFGIEQKNESGENTSDSVQVSVSSRIQPQIQAQENQIAEMPPLQETSGTKTQEEQQFPGSPFFKERAGKKNSSLSSELGQRETTSKYQEQQVQEEISEKNIPSRTFGRKIQAEPGTNRPLFYFAVMVLLLTVFSGLYYYFFVIKKTQTGWAPIELPLALDNKTAENNSSQTPTIKNDLKKELSNASKRSLNQAAFQKELKQLLIAFKADSNMKDVLENGIYVKFVSENNIPYSSKQILSLLGIESESIQSVSVDNVWAFLVLEERNTLTAELKTIKFNLIFELTKEKQNSQIVATIMDEEEGLPRQLLPLFIDEERPNIPIFVKFERSFTQSEAAPQTRYFNYEDSNGKKSIDWGVVTSEDTDYLLISTSKNSTQQFIKSLQ